MKTGRKSYDSLEEAMLGPQNLTIATPDTYVMLDVPNPTCVSGGEYEFKSVFQPSGRLHSSAKPHQFAFG